LSPHRAVTSSSVLSLLRAPSAGVPNVDCGDPSTLPGPTPRLALRHQKKGRRLVSEVIAHTPGFGSSVLDPAANPCIVGLHTRSDRDTARKGRRCPACQDHGYANCVLGDRATWLPGACPRRGTRRSPRSASARPSGRWRNPARSPSSWRPDSRPRRANHPPRSSDRPARPSSWGS
jgi:hypothetical protein